jgi:hypothetical protein
MKLKFNRPRNYFEIDTDQRIEDINKVYEPYESSVCCYFRRGFKNKITSCTIKDDKIESYYKGRFINAIITMTNET